MKIELELSLQELLDLVHLLQDKRCQLLADTINPTGFVDMVLEQLTQPRVSEALQSLNRAA